ncbi:hypothetical protein, partial [Enteractinococcus helveticum]|uniref:hypothetical protein n=1 Tax=Enteractinococcus helveticum TaxID=1837282 RepID=UPI0005B79FFC
ACRGLSLDVLFEHFHLRKTSTFLCLQHTPVTKPIYTQNSEEPTNGELVDAFSGAPVGRDRV